MITDIWIHIGFHKTGTTFLQQVLASNPEWLKQHGYIFPHTGRRYPVHPCSKDAFSGHAALMKMLKRPESENGLYQLNELNKEADGAGVNKAIILTRQINT